MEVLALALQTFVVLFTVGSLAEAGLSVAPADTFAPLAHRRFVLITLVVGWLVGPAVAYLLLQVIPLERPYATGLLLLALAPCAPFAPATMRRAGADPAYVAAFMILSAVATVAIMPVAVPLLIHGLSASPWAIARPLALFVLVPLLLGTTVRGLRPHAADRVAPVVAAITRVAAFAMLLVIVPLHGGGVLDAVGSYAILTQVIFVGVVTLAADRIGSVLTPPQRSVLTIGMCTRNLGAALAPLTAIDNDPRAIVMIVIAVPVTVGLSALVARGLARRARMSAAAPTIRRSTAA